MCYSLQKGLFLVSILGDLTEPDTSVSSFLDDLPVFTGSYISDVNQQIQLAQVNVLKKWISMLSNERK